MKHCCLDCNKQFETAQGLRRHIGRKTPCVIAIAPHEAIANQCGGCNKGFATASSLLRHARGRCRAPLTAPPVTLETITQQMQVLQNMVASLGNPIKTADGQSTPQVTNVNTINSSVTTVNSVVVNNVTIAPWGSPLQLTDADVEAALSTIPGITDSPDISEVVATLMELVKRSHIPLGARNIHINPKRADQALALTAGGWAALPLSEATAALFDKASSRIATPALSRRVVNDPLQVLRATVPANYNTEKAMAVQFGLRPMEAHLANMAPGGPGPLLITQEPALLASTAPAAPAPSNLEKVQKVLRDYPIRCGPGGALLLDWISQAAQSANITGRELFTALEAGACEHPTAWAAAQLFTLEKLRPHDSPADRSGK